MYYFCRIYWSSTKVKNDDRKSEGSHSIQDGSCISPSLVNNLALFSRELVDLLKTFPHCTMSFNRFIPAYHHHFGRQCRVADYGYTKLIDLMDALPNVVQVIGEGNRRMLTLAHEAHIQDSTAVQFDVQLLKALFEFIPKTLQCWSAGAFRWFCQLLLYVVPHDTQATASQKCFSLLLQVAKELNSRQNTYHLLLRTRYGLYGNPKMSVIPKIEQKAKQFEAGKPLIVIDHQAAGPSYVPTPIYHDKVTYSDVSSGYTDNSFPWQKLLISPPQQTIIIDRIHSGAKRFVVLDFGFPICLTDMLVPPCSELLSLSIDIWTQSEEADGRRLIVASDIGSKMLIMSDIQPPPICRYLKITAIGRYLRYEPHQV
ncbi:baculoviral IAP repeat-containing protein 6-like isoform X2 [Planococcus citri]|uniref:baculoviral IAP repeat-containing protein 6-like isoform X2 n=1 Tax=Planococcus citri TaxID=170843 RepID=UPI0031F89966